LLGRIVLAMKSTMKKNIYSVTITQTLEVEADDVAQAEEIAGSQMIYSWEPDYDVKDITHQPEQAIIEAHKAVDNDGYMFNVYRTPTDFENDNPADGGLCTGTYLNAVEMAANQAKFIR
jgi:hypothetical protein